MTKIDFQLRRMLHFQFGEEVKTGELVIGGLEEMSPDSWACHLTLPFLGLGRPEKIYGADQLQALHLCLNHVATLLTWAEADGVTKVWWLEKGDRGGFAFSDP